MRTHRLTLPVSPAEKAQIAQQAAALGISPGEYARKAATMLDAEDMAGLDAAARLFGATQPEEEPDKPGPRVKERREPWMGANPPDKKRERRK